MAQQQCNEYVPLTSDAHAALVVPLYNSVERELYPRRVAMPVGEFRARYATPTFDISMFGYEDEAGALTALGITMQWQDGSNVELQYLQMLVRSDKRRRGLGRLILERAREIADASGRTIITADAVDSVSAGEAFALSVGADVGMREHVNVVAVDDLDIGMLERWRNDAPQRAPGYELLAWTDGWPPEFDADVARLFVIAHEDMPYEDAKLEPVAETADSVRERLERTEATSYRLTSAVRHIGTGVVVGFSELATSKSGDPTLQTTITVVHRDHRGYALGKWIKADSILRGLDRLSGTRFIQTENAFSNAPMLGINEAIGFGPVQTSVVYQVSTAQVRTYLAR